MRANVQQESEKAIPSSLDIQDYVSMQLERIRALLLVISQNGESLEHGFTAHDEDIVTLTSWAAETTQLTKETAVEMFERMRGVSK